MYRVPTFFIDKIQFIRQYQKKQSRFNIRQWFVKFESMIFENTFS